MQAGDRVELLRSNGNWVVATVQRVISDNQLITLHFQEDGLIKEKNIRFRDAEKLLRLVTPVSQPNKWKLGDSLEVKRSDGHWQKAVVQEVNTVRKLYQVVFLIDGSTKGKSVPFEVAHNMLRPLSDAGATKSEAKEERAANQGPPAEPPTQPKPAEPDPAKLEAAASKADARQMPAAPEPNEEAAPPVGPPPPAQPRTYVNPLSGENKVPARNVASGARALAKGNALEPTPQQRKSHEAVVVNAGTGGHAAHLADIFEDLCDPHVSSEADWLDEHMEVPDDAVQEEVQEEPVPSSVEEEQFPRATTPEPEVEDEVPSEGLIEEHKEQIEEEIQEELETNDSFPSSDVPTMLGGFGEVQRRKDGDDSDKHEVENAPPPPVVCQLRNVGCTCFALSNV